MRKCDPRKSHSRVGVGLLKGFEPRISCLGSNRAASCATAADILAFLFWKRLYGTKKLDFFSSEIWFAVFLLNEMLTNVLCLSDVTCDTMRDVIWIMTWRVTQCVMWLMMWRGVWRKSWCHVISFYTMRCDVISFTRHDEILFCFTYMTWCVVLFEITRYSVISIDMTLHHLIISGVILCDVTWCDNVMSTYHCSIHVVTALVLILFGYFIVQDLWEKF